MKYWQRNDGFKFWPEAKLTRLIDIFSAVFSNQFLGSYALHTDPIVRGNLVSVYVCQCVTFEDEKTRDTKTSGR